MDFFQTNLFWLIIFLFEIFVIYKVSKKFQFLILRLSTRISKNPVFAAKFLGFFLLLGTFIHEFSHFITAKFLFLKTGAFFLKPELHDEKNIRLGFIEVEPSDPFRNSIVGIAPLIFGVVIIYFLVSSIQFNNFSYIDILKLILISQISNSMFLSDSDIKHFKILLLIVLFLTLVFYYLNFYFLGFNFDTKFLFIKDFLFQKSDENFTKTLSYYFGFVLILNFLINETLRFFFRIKRY